MTASVLLYRLKPNRAATAQTIALRATGQSGEILLDNMPIGDVDAIHLRE